MAVVRTPDVQRITPSQYVSARQCPARWLWPKAVGKEWNVGSAAGVLGYAFHQTVRRARNLHASTPDEAKSLCRAIFDEEAEQALAQAHLALRSRFRGFKELPYFNLQRARAAYIAQFLVRAGTQHMEGASCYRVEWELSAANGELFGRADLLELRSKCVVDYKSGSPSSEADDLMEDELLQLNLYAYLAVASQIEITSVAVIRGSGLRVQRPFRYEDGEGAAKQAIDMLRMAQAAHQNATAITDLANPGEWCRSCAWRGLCDRFWNEDSLVAEGDSAEIRVIASSKAGDFTHVTGLLQRGPLAPGTVTHLRVPNQWVCASDEPSIIVGEIVRVTGHLFQANAMEATLRPLRSHGVLWRAVGTNPQPPS